jgi:hypothetical protein
VRVLHFTGETPNPNSPSKNRPEQAKSAHENPWSATSVRNPQSRDARDSRAGSCEGSWLYSPSSKFTGTVYGGTGIVVTGA